MDYTEEAEEAEDEWCQILGGAAGAEAEAEAEAEEEEEEEVEAEPLDEAPAGEADEAEEDADEGVEEEPAAAAPPAKAPAKGAAKGQPPMAKAKGQPAAKALPVQVPAAELPGGKGGGKKGGKGAAAVPASGSGGKASGKKGGKGKGFEQQQQQQIQKAAVATEQGEEAGEAKKKVSPGMLAAVNAIKEAKQRLPRETMNELTRKAAENARAAMAPMAEGPEKEEKVKHVKFMNLARLIQQHESKSNGNEVPSAKRRRGDADDVDAVDKQGRKFQLGHIVVNFANIGATFAKTILKREAGAKAGLFDWEGIRRCCRVLKHEQGWKVSGVISADFTGTDQSLGHLRRVPIPKDILKMCGEDILETEGGGGSLRADVAMTVNSAYRRNCRFLDNETYKLQNLKDEKMKEWRREYQDLLQCRYFWDKGTGAFDLIEGNIPAHMLAKGLTTVDKKALWTASRTGT